jgi:hypothetical protein
MSFRLIKINKNCVIQFIFIFPACRPCPQYGRWAPDKVFVSLWLNSYYFLINKIIVSLP